MGPIGTIKALLAARNLQTAVENSEWRSGMGWKTITGALLLALGTALSALDDAGILIGGKAIAAGLQGIGSAFGLYGLRSAIAKTQK